MNKESNVLNLVEEKLDKLFAFFGTHFFAMTLCYFVFAFAIRVLFTSNSILRDDGFVYFLKAIEMIRGDFSPMLTSASGWPFFLSIFLRFFKNAVIFEQMFYARIVSDFFSSLAIFPLAYLAKFLLRKDNIYIPLTLLSFESNLVWSATSSYTEPLFYFLLLSALFLLYKSFKNINYLFLSSMVAASSFYVRQNGLFVMLIIVLSVFFLRKSIEKFSYKKLLLCILLFAGIILPLFIQRYNSFSSPMFYGENSKYFVDDYYTQVWSPNILAPTLTDYLKTHTWQDHINKFLVNGVYKFFLSYYFIIPKDLLFLFIFGFLLYWKRKLFLPLALVFIIWAVTLIPLWDVFGFVKHLYPTIPIAILFSSVVLENLFKHITYRHIGQVLFITIFSIISLFNLIPLYNSSKNNSDNPRDSFVNTYWADWIARNVKGKLVIQGGAEWIMSQLFDAEVGKVRAPYEYYAPQTGLYLVLPGYFQHLSQAMDWWKDQGVTHVAVDNFYIDRRSFLREIAEQRPTYFKEIYSNLNTESEWKMQVYEIDWVLYEKTQNK